MRIKLYSGLLLLGLTSLTAKAQHGLNSIYSAYGIGDLETRDYSRNFGMGSAGIGRHHPGYLNELNPASYGALPSQNFMFDIAIRGQQVSYQGTGISQTAGDLNFKRLAVGFKAAKFWGFSAGITPFSSIDYKITNQQYMSGTGAPIIATTTGTGGLNRAYLSNGFQINKHFSAGVSTAFLFGPLNTSKYIGNDSVQTQYNKYAFNPNFTAGAQYTGKVWGDWNLGLGATYRFKTTLKIQEKLTIVALDGSTLYTKEQDPSSFTIPTEIGSGISLSNGTFTWVADYRRQQWNTLKEKGANYSYQDGERFATGIEYAIQKKYYNLSYEGAILQAGFSYNKLPLVIGATQVKDVSGTLGVSLPNRNGQLRYYLGLEAGQRGSNGGAMVKETYFNAMFNFSLRDLWFLKRLSQ